MLSFLRGGRDKSPSRLTVSSDIDTVRYTPRSDRDSMEDNGTYSLPYPIQFYGCFYTERK